MKIYNSKLISLYGHQPRLNELLDKFFFINGRNCQQWNLCMRKILINKKNTIPSLYFKIKSQIALLEYGSTPEVGSSKITVFDSAIKDIATDNFRFIPPDKLHDNSSRLAARPVSHKNL